MDACPTYKYFAIQDGDQCFCGSSLSKATEYGEMECGNNGAAWCNSLYENNNITTSPTPVNKGSVLQTSKILTAGQKLTSSGTNPTTKKSAFMQSDGNFVIYDDSNDKPLWSTGSGGKGTSFMIMQPDGNLVVYKGSGPSDNKGATWATMTNGTGTDNYLSLEEGGLKIYKRAGGKNVEVWSSSTSRGITIK